MDEIPKLLIIDDSEYICCQIEQILRNENIELMKAHSGDEAIEIVKSFVPDLILLDVILPDIEGYDLYHKIKSIDKNDVSIVFLTSKDDDHDVMKGLSLGACDYIKKPFHNEILKSRILIHLGEKKSKDQLKKQNQQMEVNMKRLNSFAFSDPLTGLYNRRYVEEQLKEKIVYGEQETVFMLCDVDDFKFINDHYSHEIGDIVLIGIANIMENASSKINAVRWGGEEFLIILFDVTKEEAYRISERIRNDIAHFPFYSKNDTFHCTISIGLSRYDQSLNFIQNLECVDEALYTGKRNGKNCTVWYDEISQ